MKTTIIAELGSSPAPDWDFETWCEAAARAGADAVKVQLFHVDVLYPPHLRAAMAGRDFPRELLPEFVETAHRHGLQAGASVFDDEAVQLAAAHCDFVKLAASQEHKEERLFLVARCTRGRRLPFYRSVTDLSNLSPVFGPRLVQFFVIPRYPAGLLATCWKLVRAYHHFWTHGYSDRWGHSSHTTGFLDCLLAAGLGAAAVEKHFALSATDCEAPHSLLPGAFARMTAAIRDLEDRP
jgi:sialic acid synthase SpsE